MRRLDMKKIYLALVLVLSLSISVFAQRSDGFFTTIDDDAVYNRLDDINGQLNLPSNPIGTQSNEYAPIGNGLLILTSLGAGYAIRKRKK